ncbi:DegT/DnrJ/EryC1/StrS family aminotransferase [Mangrovihabitans endophyticus]|uniref:dTDP-4-amino-4,6-dideoxygalactose transaminase n=1 Tax=Mangrovihabitans endophyticus TaxID=1751298 RepID=A0A8J3BWP5_9ACTN|nr:DegT/DnrJ/EryC1/StrS family aminotransferase [Mangrovihabitans endophyticus]GGK75446.1 hypothetical protein GCM10012284_06790 [Mangrovihabitans endophyticus]
MLRVLHLVPVAQEKTLRTVASLARALAAEQVESEIMIGCPDGCTVSASWTDRVTTTTFRTPADDAVAVLAVGVPALAGRIADHDLLHVHDALLGPQLAAAVHALTAVPYLTSDHAADGTGDEAFGKVEPGWLRTVNRYGAVLLTAAPHRFDAPAVPVHPLPGPDDAAAARRQREIYAAVLEHRPIPQDDRQPTVRMALPDVTAAELTAASRALASAKLSAGPHVEGFEREFAAWHGVADAVAVNSAAAALFAVLRCADIRGEVIVPSFTWAATANAVCAAGATPVWVDIDEDTLGLGPERVAAAIGPRTEAVLPVHYAGHPVRIAELAGLCRQHGLLLVEDAAEAAGARQHGRPVGTWGVGCFSFYGTKNMTTGGEGGMVTTNDPSLAARIRTLRAHGMRPVPGARHPWKKEAVTAGFNFRMPEPLAAVGREQLSRLDAMNARRHAIAEQFDEGLDVLGDRVRPQRELPGFRHVYHMYVVRLAVTAARDELVARLRARGVEASVHFDPPVHRHAYYRDRCPAADGALPNTDAASAGVVTLPLYTTMPPGSVRRVLDEFTAAVEDLA